MGKKRKALKTGLRNSSPERSAKLAYHGWEDIADEQDEYLMSRDEILLDDNIAKRRKTAADEYSKLDSNEVQVLGLHSPDDSELDSEPESNADSAQDIQDYGDEDDEEFEPLNKAAAAARARAARIHISDDDEDNLENWGDSKKDYYGADELETEQAAIDEESEAKRIQLRNLETMTDADYGVDQDWLAPDTSKVGLKPQFAVKSGVEAVSDLIIPKDASPEQLTKLLKERYPEFIPLSNELSTLQSEHERLKRLVVDEGSLNTSVICKYWALGTYLALLVMYFAILTETSSNDKDSKLAKPPSEMRDHSMMNTLVSFKTTWENMEHLDEAEHLPELTTPLDTLSPAFDTVSESKTEKPQPLSSKKSASQVLRAARKAALEADLADLTKSLGSAGQKLSQSPPNRNDLQLVSGNDDDSDIGDDTEMTAHEATEKAKRRRNLRFYTSQVTQKSQKRAAASRDTRGDTDIPNRERWRDRQIRFEAEAKAKRDSRDQQQQPKPNSSNVASNGALQKERVPPNNSDDEYEDLVQRSKVAKDKRKQDKKIEFETQSAARKNVRLGEVGADGKRKISYQIAKNKGLTAARRKQLRNPRAKKRAQYENKLKKLASQKPIYKGTPAGGYAGELTGIKKNLVKSIKL